MPLINRSAGLLVLEDGTIYRGSGFGASGVFSGEVCFNTSMSGYQEIVTDPSYADQIVVMTYTQIGNVGVNPEDEEASSAHLSGFIAKEICREPSSWRARGNLDEFLRRKGVPGLEGIDTRALVRRIRNTGFQRGVISTDPESQDELSLVRQAKQAPSLDGRDLVAEVTCNEPYEPLREDWSGVEGQLPKASEPKQQLTVVAYDFGIKRSIIDLLSKNGFKVIVVPAQTSASYVDELNPDAVFFSNGPGDPAAVRGVRDPIKELIKKYPAFGICLGHQIIGLALGGSTRKLKFGHHGGNQPGQDLSTGSVLICAENHGYAVELDSLERAGEPVVVTHVNLNDRTVEGLAHRELPLFSVQYHPEASPGPHDASFFFSRFYKMALSHSNGTTLSGAQVAGREDASS